jgi:hypothetical protein
LTISDRGFYRSCQGGGFTSRLEQERALANENRVTKAFEDDAGRLPG